MRGALRPLRLLSSGSAHVDVERTGPQELRLESAEGLFAGDPSATLFRGSDHPMAVHDRVELGDMTVEVLAVDARTE